jgi:hypothetical protein
VRDGNFMEATVHMRMAKTTIAKDDRIVSRFQTVRETLLHERFSDRLEKPLSFWALPSDRRLPWALLDRTLLDLLETPFEILTKTPGIGQKKFHSFVRLLLRATSDLPPTIPFGGDHQFNGAEPGGYEFNPAIVSEAMWTAWREAVRRHNLGRERFGRVAPTLRRLPTVMWQKRLSAYLNHSLAEIRALRTHGEKRVCAVLEVFHALQGPLAEKGNNGNGESLAWRLGPKFLISLEAWIARVLSDGGSRPTHRDEVREHLIEPILAQLKQDAGSAVEQLAAGRIGLDGVPQSVRKQARRMGVTRARVYQLLEQASLVFCVRWPQGRRRLAALARALDVDGASSVESEQLRLLRDLLYAQ